VGVKDKNIYVGASETSTANPDEIKKIETTAPVTKKKSEAPVKKKEETKKEDEEEEDETSKKSLASFLTDEDEEEERQDEEEEDSSKKDKKKAPKKEEEDNNQEEQEDEEGEEDSSAEKNQFEILSKELYKLGVFTKGEDEEDAPEGSQSAAGDSTDMPPLETGGDNTASVSAEASRMEEVD